MTMGLVGWLVFVACGADDPTWPQFRGAAMTDATAKSGSAPPAQWPVGATIGWKADLPGLAWSSPIVWGDRVFVTTAVTDKLKRPTGPEYFNMGGGKPPKEEYEYRVVAIDRRTGKTLWSTTVAKGKPAIAKHPTNSYASETPATDGERIYAYFGAVGLYCLSKEGKVLWYTDLGKFKMGVDFGTGSSPLLADGRLFVQNDNEEKSFLVAFEAATGKELWRTARSGKTSWSTPVLWRNKVRAELVTCGAGQVVGQDPSSGKELWTLTGTPDTFTASPAMDAEHIVFGNSGPFSSGPLVAVKAGATGKFAVPKGDATDPNVAWVRPAAGPGMASPIIVEGVLYVYSRSFLAAYEADTGKPIYRERLRGADVTASPIASGGNLFLFDEDGKTFVVKLGRKFELVRTNKLAEGMVWATPASVAGEWLIRTAERLICLRPARD